MSTMRLKHLSSIANDVVQKCALKLDTPVDKLVEEFETIWKTDETASVGAATISSNNNNNSNSYGRKFVEFCSAKVMQSCDMCKTIEEKIANGSFSRFTFDMMLAWEMPTSADEESFTVINYVRNLIVSVDTNGDLAKPHDDVEVKFWYRRIYHSWKSNLKTPKLSHIGG
ncbi:hypothetical protein C1H46_018235 [Malus baccata]|uniref:Uncharacterized protein n=1 Tax=Malus baccata TaxID=106549 RepID=A0A540MBQ5_MALBA|nr:hypothetical protein C1H46_018235 [Malus baccata]